MPDYKNLTNILKIIEFVFALVTLCLMASFNFSCGKFEYEMQMFIIGHVIGYFMIATYVILGEVLGQSIGKTLFLIISGVGGLMYVVSGVFLIHIGIDAVCEKGIVISGGAFALATAILYLVDFVLANRK